MSASMGHASRISFGATSTAVGSFSEAIEFVSESLKKTNEILDTNGITGDRSHKSERTRFGVNNVGGMINMHWSPLLGDLMLPRALGANESTDVFALANTLPGFDVLVDRIVQRHVYRTCYVNSAEWEFTPGQLVPFTLDIRGTSEELSATAFPSITPPVDYPFTCSDLAGTFVGSAREIISMRIRVDNALNVRFTNSNNATDISPTDRVVSVQVTVPYISGNSDLYSQALLGSAGTVTLTNGNTSTQFALGKVQFPDESPVISQRNGEIVLVCNGIARMTGSTKELVITHDSST